MVAEQYLTGYVGRGCENCRPDLFGKDILDKSLPNYDNAQMRFQKNLPLVEVRVNGHVIQAATELVWGVDGWVVALHIDGAGKRGHLCPCNCYMHAEMVLWRGSVVMVTLNPDLYD